MGHAPLEAHVQCLSYLTLNNIVSLKIWVRGHSRSFKFVPFESLGAVSYLPSMALSCAAPWESNHSAAWVTDNIKCRLLAVCVSVKQTLNIEIIFSQNLWTFVDRFTRAIKYTTCKATDLSLIMSITT